MKWTQRVWKQRKAGLGDKWKVSHRGERWTVYECLLPDEKSNNNPLIICQMFLLYIEEFIVVSIRPTGRLGPSGGLVLARGPQV